MRPIEYPLHIPGLTSQEAGRAYVAARFGLNLVQLLSPHAASLKDWAAQDIIDKYWGVCRMVSLTDLFARSDRSVFSRGTHATYFGNTGICNRTKVMNLTAYLAAEMWPVDLQRVQSAGGFSLETIQRLLEVSGWLVAKSHMKLHSTEVLVDILIPGRRGSSPDIQTTARVDVELINIPT